MRWMMIDDRNITIIMGLLLCAYLAYVMPPQTSKELIQIIIAGVFGIVTGQSMIKRG
jgi:hypothetical protein